jgi:hypothetical protein
MTRPSSDVQPQPGLRAARWGFLVDEGYVEVLLRLDPVLATDLWGRLRWCPMWSDAGQGWRIPRPLLHQVQTAAEALEVSLYDCDRLELAG